MNLLIDDLLKLSRLGRGEMQRDRVDLSEIVRGVDAMLCEREPTRNVTMELEKSVAVIGDSRLLAIAIQNLLENSWKFTRGRSPALISFFTTQQDGRRLIGIADNGTGFDMRFRHKLFTPFQRLHHVSEFEGTGIGLATVSRIVVRHGGEVWIEGVKDHGTTVFMFLPSSD